LPEAPLVVIGGLARSDHRVVHGARTALEREKSHDQHAQDLKP
jgi:hypothetical protein